MLPVRFTHPADSSISRLKQGEFDGQVASAGVSVTASRFTLETLRIVPP